MFAGSAGVRNTIVVLAKDGRSGGVRTTRYMRWLAEGRPHIFTMLNYISPNEELFGSGDANMWPFISDRVLSVAFAKMLREHKPLEVNLRKGSGHLLGYKSTALYTLPVYTEEPPTVHPETREPIATKSKTTGWLELETREGRDLALLMLAGRWGYLWWLTFSDEFHVTRKVLSAFPGDIERLTRSLMEPHHGSPLCDDAEIVGDLLRLSRVLQEELPKHMAWMVKAGVDVGRYDMLKVRHITDRGDYLLALLWGVADAYEAAGNLRDRMTFGNKD